MKLILLSAVFVGVFANASAFADIECKGRTTLNPAGSSPTHEVPLSIVDPVTGYYAAELDGYQFGVWYDPSSNRAFLQIEKASAHFVTQTNIPVLSSEEPQDLVTDFSGDIIVLSCLKK